MIILWLRRVNALNMVAYAIYTLLLYTYIYIYLEIGEHETQIHIL